MFEGMCPCGLPLHYTDPVAKFCTQRFIEQLGYYMEVTVAGLGTWRVPRHFIALHGFKGYELPALAEKYKWEKIKDA